MARVLGWPVCGAIDSLGGLSVLLWTVPPDPIKEGPSNNYYLQAMWPSYIIWSTYTGIHLPLLAVPAEDDRVTGGESQCSVAVYVIIS